MNQIAQAITTLAVIISLDRASISRKNKLMPSLNLKLKIRDLKFEHGFTLIELLVTISIIGILAAIGSFAYTDSQKKSRDTRRKSDIDAIKKAMELAKQDSPGAYSYPNCDSYTTTGSDNWCELTATNTNPDLVPSSGTPYIKAVPTDPKTGTTSPFNSDYFLVMPTACTSNTCTTYTLVTCIENIKDPQKDATAFSQCPSGTTSYRVASN